MSSLTRRAHLRLLTAVAVLGLLVAAGCVDDDDAEGGAGSDVTADDLTGWTFRSSAVEGATLVEGSQVTIAFVDGPRFSAQAGCNTMNAGYELADGVLVAGEIAQTMMGCEDDLQAQDEWLSALLSGRPTVTLDGETLTLSGDGGTLTLEGTAE
jgi:heat shock protein HslJ